MAASICPTLRGSIRPKSKTPKRPTRRFGRPAIRSISPSSFAANSGADEFKIYDLIWKRTVASQMADARGRRMTITIAGERSAIFSVSGKTIEFPGYLRAYVEGSDDPHGRFGRSRGRVAGGRRGRPINCRDLTPKEHTTQAPARFSEAALDPHARRNGDWPAEHLCLDHRHDPGPRICVQEGAMRWCPPGSAFAVSQLLEIHLPAFGGL